jgi:serine protease Do
MKTALLIFAGALTFVHTAPAQPPPPFATPRGASFIGVMVQEIDSERARALKLREEAGVEITRVEPDSPAEKAGLRVGDVILDWNGSRIEGMEQFSRLVRETPPGREVKLDYIRNGAQQSAMFKIGMRRPVSPIPPAPPERPDMHMPDMPRTFMSWRSSSLGVECETLDGQLAQYFGVKDGVLVRSVLKNTAAERAGVKAGDVIVKVEDAKVTSPADISAHIHAMRGKAIPVVLVRDHKEMSLTISFDDDNHG